MIFLVTGGRCSRTDRCQSLTLLLALLSQLTFHAGLAVLLSPHTHLVSLRPRRTNEANFTDFLSLEEHYWIKRCVV